MAPNVVAAEVMNLACDLEFAPKLNMGLFGPVLSFDMPIEERVARSSQRKLSQRKKYSLRERFFIASMTCKSEHAKPCVLLDNFGELHPVVGFLESESPVLPELPLNSLEEDAEAAAQRIEAEWRAMHEELGLTVEGEELQDVIEEEFRATADMDPMQAEFLAVQETLDQVAHTITLDDDLDIDGDIDNECVDPLQAKWLDIQDSLAAFNARFEDESHHADVDGQQFKDPMHDEWLAVEEALGHYRTEVFEDLDIDLNDDDVVYQEQEKDAASLDPSPEAMDEPMPQASAFSVLSSVKSIFSKLSSLLPVLPSFPSRHFLANVWALKRFSYTKPFMLRLLPSMKTWLHPLPSTFDSTPTPIMTSPSSFKHAFKKRDVQGLKAVLQFDSLSTKPTIKTTKAKVFCFTKTFNPSFEYVHHKVFVPKPNQGTLSTEIYNLALQAFGVSSSQKHDHPLARCGSLV